MRGECGVYLNAFASNRNWLFSCRMLMLLSSLSSSLGLIWMVRGSEGPSNIMLSSSSGVGDGCGVFLICVVSVVGVNCSGCCVVSGDVMNSHSSAGL